jgi:diaminopimelate epimerase
MKFTKMHGAGNDYIYVNCFTEHIKNPSEIAKQLSHRHYGVGSDGLILICPTKNADVEMKMFNADGTESSMCGNGLRCVAKYAQDHIIANSPQKIQIESHSQIYEVKVQQNSKNKKLSQATINMGIPKLSPSDIPCRLTEEETIVNRKETFLDKEFEITCVSMGNPHTVIYVNDVDNFDIEKYGPVIETDPIFPERTNVEFVEIISNKEVKQRTWERGSGETWACGSGASAVCVAGLLTGITQSPLTVHLLGGDLKIEWKKGSPLLLSGPAEEVFTGEV